MPTIEINTLQELKRFIQFKLGTIEEFANQMKISRQIIWFWFTGVNKPSKENLEKMSKLLNFKKEDLKSIFKIK